GLPAENLARTRDVRLPNARVVDRQGLVDDVALRSGDLDYRLRQLVERELARIPDVDREMLVRLREQDQTSDEVVDVAEAPGLRAVAEDRQRLVRKRLTDERWDRAPVVRP